MAYNTQNSSRLSPEYTNDGGGIPQDTGPYIGIVMDNHDPTRNGRVSVWLKTFGALDKDNPANWRTISYLSPFFGSTPHKLHDESDSTMYQNSHSYGMWMTSPDLGVEVMCLFVNGDPNMGYYVGYVPQPQMNHMVPANGARDNNNPATANNTLEADSYANAKKLPTIEISKSTEAMTDGDFYRAPRPIHSVVSAQMWKQGTITDEIRGPIGTSSQRESPSYAYGINTPGRPVYQSGLHEFNGMSDKMDKGGVNADDVIVEARRGGHSFVMDDGDMDGNDVLMRFRTATGHQISLSDNGACINIAHANGDSWIELGNEGTVDIYTTNSINLRSKGELNFHADNNINFYSGKDIKMYAKENIRQEAEINFDIIGKEKVHTFSEKKILIKTDGILSTQSAQKTTIKAGGNITQQGAEIHLNDEKADNIQKPKYITSTSLPDTSIIGATGWTSTEATLDSIVSRAPTHEPYAYHNEGVPVKVVSGEPTTPLPKPAPTKTQSKIDNIAAKPPINNPVTPAIVGEQANITSDVKQIGNMTPQTIMSTMTQHADSVGQIASDISVKGLGKFGIQPMQLVQQGIIKNGVLDPLKQSTTEMFAKLSDPSLFAGLNEINSLADLASENIQSQIVQQGMNDTFGALTKAGTLLGTESASDMISLVGTSLVALPGQVVDWVGGSLGNISIGGIGDVITGIGGDIDIGGVTLDSAMNLVSKGSQFATSLAEGPGLDMLSGMLDKGSIPRTLLSTVDNIDSTVVDGVADILTNNPKIPSIGAISANVKASITGFDPLEFIGDIPSSIDDALSSLNPGDILDTALEIGDDQLLKIAKSRIQEFI